jgi:neutral amino acid transport system substrate-binding protein
LSLIVAAPLVGCTSDANSIPPNAIVIGSLLPFTGQNAAMGNDLEQAMLLAIDDVNAVGGVQGRPLALISRDSNSGSMRGLNALLELLYIDQVRYLVGPEEGDLANQIVSDVKALDVLNVLPGYTAPSVKRQSTSGAWMRLAPSVNAIGCGMATSMTQQGVMTANSMVALDDYNQSLASEFSAQFGWLGGQVLPSVTLDATQASFTTQITRAFSYGADRTLLIAYPGTASTVVTEWALSGGTGAWFLSPMLQADAFLLNVPYGALEGQTGVSPSLNLQSECVVPDSTQPDRLTCTGANAKQFGDHFEKRWGGRPFPEAHLYYDAVVLIAMGLERSLAGGSGNLPTASALQQNIRTLATADATDAPWFDLKSAFALVDAGNPVQYVGAAAEYDFDQYGAAINYEVFDTWRIQNQQFVATDPLQASCPQDPG